MNIQLATESFQFTQHEAGAETTVGTDDLSTGHVHLYLDGQKIARVDSEWFHIPDMSPGEHVIRATLNTNDHRDYARDGRVVAATATITQD